MKSNLLYIYYIVGLNMNDWSQYLKDDEEYGPNSKFNISNKGLSGKLDLVEVFSNDPIKFSNVKKSLLL